ncbi:MAG: acetoacetate decarboxylase family protein [Spirosomataceae bacterium]
MQPTQITPAPWSLTGNGYIFLYRFSSEFAEKHGFLADYQQKRFKGIIGTVMLVNYETSGVGPYQELLFIPGLFDFGGKNAFSISKIYVSTYNSVWNGINNWGIPKELADFEWKSNGPYDDITVRLGDTEIFSAQLKKVGWQFPLTTALTPVTVAQAHAQDLICTKPTAQGKGQWTRLLHLNANPSYFPNLTLAKPLAVIAANRFRMTFPVPVIEQDFFKAIT